ncbi:membrane-spanning 4-domains subfamily A member 4A-like [Colossoma macropomum]|uniref:membrane-spanning 4-domains subfamily A member 4A-like n=1 Tax=Colossoma macropomum TaxID=42526 RepID=UPI0018648E5B|nr:membrane-spanning 4-domains subfamily A member 4A-like [Colossoma macropomum]XP_036427257.1 membrane-spanning 4-domains subfamily A member 4A-like [Colossoma macropomum]XP_036427258.1 membrane-spanning 4-domains subfamily A member 4A-like [Colossoma macropomum]
MSTTAVPLSNTGNGYTIVTHVIPPPTSTEIGENISTGGPLQKFLKGEPKALGTVQIMIGLMTFMFGIVITIHTDLVITVYSGIAFWGALMYIITGSLAVAASNKLHRCVVKGALVMNVLSSIVAGTAIILLSLDFVISALLTHCRYDYDGSFKCNKSQTTGINAVLLIFSIMQFIISICVSAFAYKSTCKAEPSVNVTVVPNRVGCCSVVNPFPAHNIQQYPMYAISGATMNSPPMESPPEYTEIKCQPEN